MHNEFVVEFKNGKRDWIDPVEESDVSIVDGEIIVDAVYEYRFKLDEVSNWAVRPYSEETTYDAIG